MQNIWLNRASHRAMGFLWGGSESIRNHFLLDEQNRDLTLENERLSEKLRAYELRDSQSKEAAAAVRDSSGRFKYTPATIVKMSRNSAHNYIILNKGSLDGIKPQSGIITGSGVVGIVNSVDKHYSYGLTLMNSNVSIGARIGRTELVGPLVWDGRSSRGAYLENIPPHYEITPGDTVRTSGYSTIFPPDIPIGTAGSTTLIDGSTIRVDVKLFQDFASIHYVTVVENLDRAEILSIEEKEDLQ